jgi:serine/threonine-protein kinase RsbW
VVDRQRERPHAAWPPDRHRLDQRLRIWLPCSTAALNRAAGRVRRLAARGGFSSAELPDVEIAVREALANAVRHGNGRVPHGRIFLRCYAGAGAGILIAVRDQGPGFDPAAVPDPRAADRQHLPHGRGLLIMRTLMDRVEHRHGGREVVLYKGSGLDLRHAAMSQVKT